MKRWLLIVPLLLLVLLLFSPPAEPQLGTETQIVDLGTFTEGSTLRLTIADFTDEGGVTPVLPEALHFVVASEHDGVALYGPITRTPPTDPQVEVLPVTANAVTHPDFDAQTQHIIVVWDFAGGTRHGKRHFKFRTEGDPFAGLFP